MTQNDIHNQLIETLTKASEQIQDAIKGLEGGDSIGVEPSPLGGGLQATRGWRSNIAKARQLLGYAHKLQTKV